MEQQHDEHGNALEGQDDVKDRETPTADQVLTDENGVDEAAERAKQGGAEDPEAD
jgi:hypothetical protein